MQRLLAIYLFSLLVVISAEAQRPIQWISNLNQGISQSQQSGKPLMIYVTGKGDSSDDDILEAQQNAFRDPLIVSIAQARFVPVRVALSSQTKGFLSELGASPDIGKYLVFATPELKPLGVIQPNQAANKSALPSQMTQIFRKYRNQVYREKMKPKIEASETDFRELENLLEQISGMLIEDADADVVKLITSGRLDKNKKTLKEAYDTLSTLSTQASIDHLLKAGKTDKLAEKALYRCTEGAADYLLSAFSSEDDDEFILAYQAIVKICNLGKPKPRGFWYGKNERLIEEELNRVKQGAENAAKEWRRKYEAYR